jgi:PAP2 superfamily
VQPATLAIRVGGVGGLLLDAVRAHAVIIALVLAYAACGLLISTLLGHSDKTWPALYVGFYFSKSLLLLLFYVFARLLHAMVIVRPARLLEHVWRDFRYNPDVHRQLAAGLPLVIVVPVFFSVFASLKGLIPEINPFTWDVTLAEWDRVAHGGLDPWRILQPIFGHPVVTFALDLVYCSWFYVLQLVCIWQAFSVSRPQLRMQFFLTFLLVWVVLGNVGAVILSSVGPCFYGRLMEIPGPYQPLVDYLRDASGQFPLWSLEMQAQLWAGYLNPTLSIAGGISAMPSIHVAMAWLLTLLGWQVHRLLGVVLAAYAALILISSVHLGWHYAIDGYAAIAGTYVIWRAVGWLIARRETAIAIPATP